MEEKEARTRSREITSRRRIPVATYRLQFNRDFKFADAAQLTDYLRELGISDCYASPILKASPKSTHGYDITSFDELNPDLGSDDDFNGFTEKLRLRGMGLIFDMVPNHMSNHHSNRWWSDVLSQGRASEFSSFFDIDWRGDQNDPSEKILVPILEDRYAQVLEAGKIQVLFEFGKFVVAYYDWRFTLSPETQTSLRQQAGATSSDTSRAGIETFLNHLNGTSGSSKSFDRLDSILRAQHFRLAHWKVGPEEINYRHFFDIPELVSLRAESPKVFEECHRILFQLLQDGKVTGLRVDHPDGLSDPQGYMQRLQENYRSRTGNDKSLFLIVEKILADEEWLPTDWPVDGTTGYDFLNCLNGIFVQNENKAALDKIYRDFTSVGFDFSTAVYAGNKKILRIALISEWHALTRRLKRIAASTRYGWDFSYDELHAAIGEIIATFPVYRTYVRADTATLTANDRCAVEQSVADAKERNPKSDHLIFDFIGKILSLEFFDDMDEVTCKRARDFVIKFQQVSGPAMAKGLEDTAFYRFNRLVSLNEVGGNAEKFGRTTEEFHRSNQLRAARWPHSLLATSTHDTKRGEDFRARLNVISEMPDDWHFAVMKWRQINADKKISIHGQPAPDANDEYLLYQTLVGAWPFEMNSAQQWNTFRERIVAYMLKAVREAKVHTSWIERNAEYEDGVKSFVEKILVDGPSPFLEDFKLFQRKVAFFGIFNSLSQLLLKVTCPGVPDFYQGSELLDFNLVDPDNRRPVDYELRRKLLVDLQSQLAAGQDLSVLFQKLFTESQTGQIKLFAMHLALKFRNEYRELFECGEYIPLEVRGANAENICAFARVWKDSRVIVVAPRFVFKLTGGKEITPTANEVWLDTVVVLPNAGAGTFCNVLTRETVSAIEDAGRVGLKVSEALKSFPLGLLAADS